MKKCGYCGRDNDDSAVRCGECGTELIGDSPATSFNVLRCAPKAPLAVAILAGIGAVLLCTGAYVIIGKALLDFLKAFYPGKVPKYLAGSSIALVMPHLLEVILGVGAVVSTATICSWRCRKRSHAVITAILAIGVITVLRLMPGIGLGFVPAFLLGAATNSSTVFYIVAAAQLGAGAWMIGCFRERGSPDETRAQRTTGYQS